jgi:hypothetical protein
MVMCVKDIVNKFTTENGFEYDISSVMTSIIGGKGLWDIEIKNNEFIVREWGPNWCEKTQSYIEPPTSQEIRNEYIRQQTIAECIEYFKDK